MFRTRPRRRGSFPVYTAGEKGAVVFCVHGGGYTGLTWSLVARQLKDRRVPQRRAAARARGRAPGKPCASVPLPRGRASAPETWMAGAAP